MGREVPDGGTSESCTGDAGGQTPPGSLGFLNDILRLLCSPCPTEMVFIVTLWARSAGEGGFRAVRGGSRGGSEDGSMRMLGLDEQVKVGRKS